MATPAPPFLVFAAMRNEGAFIVEWVTWYRMLGFEVLIATNDCTDRSPDLLDCLAGHGWLHHVRHSPREGRPPKQSAYRAGQGHPVAKGAGRVLVVDADEFLVLKDCDTIGAFVESLPPALGIAVPWRCFGDSEKVHYTDAPVHQTFRRSGPRDMPPNLGFKTLFAEPANWRAWHDHTPLHYKGNLAASRWITPSGRPLPRFADADAHPIRSLRPDERDDARAQINHYVIRWRESFELKRGQPSASALRDRYTDRFLRRHNRNGYGDTQALRFSERFAALHATAMALEGVAQLHHLCCADYVAAICARQGLPAETDPRYIHHMTNAGQS